METLLTNPVASPPPPAPPAIAQPLRPPVQQSGFQSLLNKRNLWIAGVVVFVGMAALCYWLFSPTKVVYVTATVVRGDVQSTVVAAGIVQPVKYVDVGAQTSGTLKSLKVDKGDEVIRGQLLAEIDSTLSETALDAGNAALQSTTSQHALKKATLVLTGLQRDRNDDLFAHALVSASDRDITRANYYVAFADAASLSSQMEEAKATVNTDKANVGYTKIKAPMAGEIVSISLLEGQTLNANQSAPNILRIADIGTMTIWSQVSEADIVRVKDGQDVYFTILGDTKLVR